MAAASLVKVDTATRAFFLHQGQGGQGGFDTHDPEISGQRVVPCLASVASLDDVLALETLMLIVTFL